MAIEFPKSCAELINEDPMIIRNAKTWSHYHTYGGWGKFFKGLREKKILATRCTTSQCDDKRP